MGTSLSGLTPATTFDGLLKVGDNDPLTADLKAISTGDGTDTILQLSNSALSIGGNVTITGTTNDDTANSLLIERLDGTDLFQVRNDRNIYFGSTQYIRNGYRFYGDWEAYGTWDFNNDVNIGTGTGVANTRLLVKGSGATSATTSLLVQNSAGDDVFSIKDNGLFTFNDVGGNDALTIENGANISEIRYNDNLWLGSSHGTYVPTLKIDRTAGLSVETNSRSLLNLLYDTGNLGIGETTPTARLHIKGSGNDNTTTSLLVQNSDGANLFKVDDSGIGVLVNDDQAGYIRLYASGEYGTIGGGRILRITSGGANPLMISGSGSNGVVIGSTSATTLAANTALAVKGQGATSATTALLVQNSAGAQYLSVKDNGEFLAGTGYNKISGGGNVLNLDFIALNYRIGASNVIGRMTTAGLKLGDGADPTAKLQVKGSGNDNTTTALLVQNSDGTDGFWAKDNGSAYVRGNFGIGTPNPGQTLSVIGTQQISGRITANGGITASNAQSTFKGSGATSATTALLVQNSAGTDLLKVTDDGNINVGGNKSISWGNGAQYIKATTYGDIQIRNNNANSHTSITIGGFLVNAENINASAVLQADSTTKGFLPPRMTDAERDAITSPAAGLMVYDTSNNQMNYWNGTTWIAF